jgi:peptidoglycan hydrolase-like protein with peptidoglycan-binding domain
MRIRTINITIGKEIKVVFDDAATREIIENYLGAEQTIRVPGEGLLDFKEVTILPTESVDNMKTALTRIWEKTGVHVDWSRPVA